MDHFRKERETFQYLMNNKAELEKRLEEGESRAKVIAGKVLDRARKKLGFRD